ncbi:MFS transporter [Desulforamulus aeronauticus]|uniref:Predicted arabinose efflux permease, MFS family n=1 Tax=Desulforamulus aeronauticus DSM 10349 TaxID=1121421 RepID=A0A1M6NUS0_9FIRM|nr:MFS transporter [Desulforamulus aeronauticus]SHJ99446.1 Predicted arabinose efflux permease, MFS family [Desulforamulus aeronauticus DSM 10349]
MVKKVLIIAVGLLMTIMSFTGFVNYMTFASNYNHSLVNAYSVAGSEFVRKIEYALGYGKPIDNYYGMQDTLNQLKDFIPELEQVNIVSPQGDILYDLRGFVRDRHLPGELLKAAVFQQGFVKENLSYRFYQEKVYLFIGINQTPSDHNSPTHSADLVMVFPKSTFLQFNSHFIRHLAAWSAGVTLIALLLLAVIFFRAKLFQKEYLTNKKILIVFVMVIGGAQLTCTGVNYFLFTSAYRDMAYTSRDFVQNIVQKNIDDIYAKGLSLENITGFDQYLDSIKTGLPQIDDIRIVESGTQGSPPSKEVQVTVSDDYVNQQIFKVLLDMLTVLVISIFFMVEITLLAVVVMMIRGPTQATDQGIDANPKIGRGLIRSLVFFVNLCACMSITFVPIVMKDLYQPVPGLSTDVILGLPLSAEMLGGILAIFLTSWSITKRGWRRVLYTGTLLLALGNLLAGFSVNELLFVISRGIAGWGLGHILMALRGLVVSLPEPNIAIAEYSAGAIAGLNCGLVIGGLLADRIGYGAVFYVSAVLVIVPFIFVRRFMTALEIKERAAGSASAWEKFTDFITAKKTLLFLLCIFIPYFISGAFLDYYFPLFASANGLSQSDISRGFLLNGLFIIYLGPVLAGYAAKKLGSIKGMVVSMSIVICALTVFIVYGTIAAALATIILLGIAESFSVSLKTTYFLTLKGVRDLSIHQGIAYFSGMVNLSRMAGPMIYGLALSLGTRMGISLISLGILLLLLVFILSTRFEPTHGKEEN